MRLFNKFNWFKIFVRKQNSCNIKTLRYDKVREFVSNDVEYFHFYKQFLKKITKKITKHGLKINGYLSEMVIENSIFEI